MHKTRVVLEKDKNKCISPRDPTRGPTAVPVTSFTEIFSIQSVAWQSNETKSAVYPIRDKCTNELNFKKVKYNERLENRTPTCSHFSQYGWSCYSIRPINYIIFFPGKYFSLTANFYLIFYFWMKFVQALLDSNQFKQNFYTSNLSIQNLVLHSCILFILCMCDLTHGQPFSHRCSYLIQFSWHASHITRA